MFFETSAEPSLSGANYERLSDGAATALLLAVSLASVVHDASSIGVTGGLYNSLWVCKISLILVAIGIWFERPFLVLTCFAAVMKYNRLCKGNQSSSVSKSTTNTCRRISEKSSHN